MPSGKVVVRTSLSIESLKNGEVYAAHLNGMGLTGYGRAPSEAREAVKRLFKVWVDGYRKLGVLEARLDRIGADWRQYEDYQGDVPVEDVAPGVNAAVRRTRSPGGRNAARDGMGRGPARGDGGLASAMPDEELAVVRLSTVRRALEEVGFVAGRALRLPLRLWKRTVASRLGAGPGRRRDHSACPPRHRGAVPRPVRRSPQLDREKLRTGG